MNGRREISEHDADKGPNRGDSRADGATSESKAATYYSNLDRPQVARSMLPLYLSAR
jgi:hypothetical protein